MAVAFEAMNECMRLADEFGSGTVAVDNAFHYLWGGGYVIDAADKGYIAYTCCTAALAEVVPFGGKFPTLGTNPHSWAFPTRARDRLSHLHRLGDEHGGDGPGAAIRPRGRALPPGSAVDAEGRETTDPGRVAALLPFGQHKGYGLALIDELLAAYIGGSLPTLRSRWKQGDADEKHTPTFYFQCIHPEAIGCDDFAQKRTQDQNVKAVIEDVLGHGNGAASCPARSKRKRPS